MKIKTYFYAPLFGAMVALALTACSDDLDNGKDSNRPQGNGIVFGANANYAGDGVETRTEYGDYNNSDPTQATSQEILWTDGDRVDVYSPTSPNQTKVEYEIANIGTGGDNGKAYLASYNGQNGLQWDKTELTQDFYAVYPSKNSMTNTTIRDQYVNYENGVLTGYVPINQQHTISQGGETGWTATPNMDYLYMAAINEDFTVPTDGTDGGVNLDFMPLVTTLEVTIVGPTTRPLASMNVEANGVAVAGQFQCDLINGRRENGVPVCTSLQQGTTNDYVTVSLYTDQNKPLSLASGESVTFNVFLLPTADLNNVSIRIAGFNSANRTMTLTENGTPITLYPHQKTRVVIPAPTIGEETNTWITGIDDNVYVSQLSIPGTANSFSYLYSGENPDWYKTQTATLQQQWDAGIRCFELRGTNNTSGDDLADAPLQCNRQNVGITFGEAVRQINDLVVANPGEFAMIIPAFESNEGRVVEDYASDLNNFYRNHNYNYITYGRDITVEEARGGLMFIARITSEEDGPGFGNRVIEDPVQGVFIDEWGSLKDNWARRGYNVPNWAIYNNSQWESSMEYGMIEGNRSAGYEPTLPTKGLVDFMHATTRADGSRGTAYIQDWSRVVPASGNYELYSDYNGAIGLQGLNYTQYAYWKESFNEKCGDVVKTFTTCIADNSDKQGSTFYINSLDGYYIDRNIPQSYVPYVEGRSDSYTPRGERQTSFSYTQGGMAGNIADYATDINQFFYEYILGYGEENIYGPMNIVIMDMVYATDASSYLPSVIINNNYRFPLETAGGSTAQTDADASYTNGGAAWE